MWHTHNRGNKARWDVVSVGSWWDQSETSSYMSTDVLLGWKGCLESQSFLKSFQINDSVLAEIDWTFHSQHKDKRFRWWSKWSFVYVKQNSWHFWGSWRTEVVQTAMKLPRSSEGPSRADIIVHSTDVYCTVCCVIWKHFPLKARGRVFCLLSIVVMCLTDVCVSVFIYIFPTFYFSLVVFHLLYLLLVHPLVSLSPPLSLP